MFGSKQPPQQDQAQTAPGTQPGHAYQPVPSSQPPGGYAASGAGGSYSGRGGPPTYKAKPNSAGIFGLIWFGAACCVMIGAGITFIIELVSLEWVDALEMVYMLLFGLILAVIDTPFFVSMKWVGDMRNAVGFYVAVLVRITGKGIAYIFLGATLFASMWNNLEGTFLKFLAILFGLVVVLVGMLSVLIGALKSKNLDAVKRMIKQEQGGVTQLYQKHARRPQQGMTTEEFRTMAETMRGMVFNGSDLYQIFKAISTDPDRNVLTQEDFENWVQTSFVFL